MEWHLLPEGMRALKQWVCADDKKQPRNANTGEFAEVNDPSTWCSFEQACKGAISNGWDIGFVLSIDDEYVIVDLDNKPHNPAPVATRKIHADIINRSDTYIERSTSGTGYHVIMTGSLERPIKTEWIEMYSSHRFMICTGDVVKDLPVADGSPLIAVIEEKFGKQNTYVDPLGQLPDQAPGADEESDEIVLQRCRDAENGEKFISLWEGDLSLYNGDHSRADSALLNLLCFMTPHNEQVRRMFRASKLYRPQQRNRCTNRYLNYSITKWRGENPTIDLSMYSLDMLETAVGQTFSNQSATPVPEDNVHTAPVLTLVPKAPVSAVAEPQVPKAPASSEPDFPPGIIGDIARYALRVSYTPTPESALSSAIGYMCGLIARGFHVGKIGLNQYVVLIADSGVGKESGKRAINALHKKVVEKVPAAQYVLGSADFSAGVSLVKELAINPCFLGIAGEVGVTLKIMLDKKAPAHTRELKRALTDCWTSSGPDGVMHSRKYSDQSKNAADVRRPNFSILGESVPSHFYGALSTETANDGFITRWIVIEYKGNRPLPNWDADMSIPEKLVERLQDLYVVSKTVQDSNGMTEVVLSSDAKMFFREFEMANHRKMNSLPVEHPVKAILNRTHEKAIKIAALLAACENPYEPVVSLAQAQWAIAFIEKCDGHMISRFEEGSVGDGDETFESHVRLAIRAYQKMTPQQKLSNKCPKCLLDKPCIPRAYFADYLKRRSVFSSHRFGAMKAVETAINECLDNGLLLKVPADQKKLWDMRGGEAYLLGSGF